MTSPHLPKALALVVGALLALSGLAAISPAQATATGAVSGTVVDSSGDPVSGVLVELGLSTGCGDEYDILDEVTTTSSGAYRFSDLEVLGDPECDIYIVNATDPHDYYLNAQARPVVKGGETTVADLTLEKGATISGKLTRADGKSPRSVVVSFETDSNDPDDYQSLITTVDAEGNYTISGAVAGSGWLEFEDTSGDYLTQCYDNVQAANNNEFACFPDDVPAAKKVTVDTAEDITVKDQELSRAAGVITGKVTDTKLNPIRGVYVTLYEATTGEQLSLGDQTDTGGNGIFYIDSIPPGDWKLNVAGDGTWADYWFNGKTSQETATPITVEAGGTVSDLAVKLKPAAE